MKLRFLLIIATLLFEYSYANRLIERDTIPTPSQVLDSILLSEKLEWSVRFVTNFKQQQFRLSNEESSLIYRPNNPFGVGFGFANQKIVIDIVFNLKTDKDEQTNKFAAEGAIILNKNLFGFIIENVHGYKITSRQTDQKEFRKDISAYSLGLEYLRILSKNNITVRGMKSGFEGQRKTIISYGLGGFILLRGFSADGSIVPEADRPYYNDQAQIYDLETFGGGLLGGISSYFDLPANFFATLYFAPGIGLEYKYIKSETQNYIPDDPIIFKADVFASLGYNREKFYVHFTFGTDWYLTSLDYDNNIFLSVTKSKFIVGYNLGRLKLKK